MNYGHGNAIMILVADKMGLRPPLVDEAKRHLEGGSIHAITAKAMEDAAVHANDQLRSDATMIAQANLHANEIKSLFGFAAQTENVAIAGVPSDQLKATVLQTVYHLDGLKVLSGYKFLAAKHLTTNVGIFVVNGNFGREHFKIALAEAKAAGIGAKRMYVYGQTATYSGNLICFCKFDEIGLNVEQASA